MTLPGHKEAISGVIWTENNEVISSSWDHTIKGIQLNHELFSLKFQLSYLVA